MDLTQKEQDIRMMLAAQCHLGTKNCDFQMERYVYRRRNDGIYVINLNKTWEKLQMAARAIVAVENPQDIVVMSARPYGQRAVLKMAQYTQTQSLAGRHVPGTFTNQIQKAYVEPRVLCVTDPRTDHQPIKEASYVNVPVIAFCDTDSPLQNVDIAIPANNKGKHSIGVLYYILARMVLQMRGTLPYAQPWDVAVDLFFYRDPEETKPEEEEEAQPDFAAPPAAEDFAAPAPGAFEPALGGAGFEAAPGPAAAGFEAAAAPAPAAEGAEGYAAPPADFAASAGAGY